MADPWAFDASVQEVTALLKPLAERWDRQEAEDDAAWAEFFGPLLAPDEAARLLAVGSDQAVAELARNKNILALPTKDGRQVYPAFQFRETGGVYPEIARIIAIKDGVVVTPYTIASWLQGPKAYLHGNSPMR